jgi:small-conductance mechanosensitive channel
LARIGRAVLADVPDLIFLAVLIIVVRYVLRIFRVFFDAVEQGTVTLSDFDPEWGSPTFRVVRICVLAFAMVVAYPYIPGSNSEAFKGVSIFVGLLLSIGSTSFVANIIAGYTLIYRRAFKPGDRIKVDDVLGDVICLRLQATYLRTLKNEEAIVPNSIILNSLIVNYSALARQPGLILHTTVGIGYETPWRQVEAMLLLAAEHTPGLLREPQPFVRQQALGDFAVTYELNAYCNDARMMTDLYTDLHRNILDVFNEYGVQIMTPAYEVDPETPKIVPRDAWFAAPAQTGVGEFPMSASAASGDRATTGDR